MVDSPMHHKQVLAAIWGKLRGEAGQLDIDGCTATAANPWATQLENYLEVYSGLDSWCKMLAEVRTPTGNISIAKIFEKDIAWRFCLLDTSQLRIAEISRE
eukprot:1911750-Heterocapsa_arctica.AAC.1